MTHDYTRNGTKTLIAALELSQRELSESGVKRTYMKQHPTPTASRIILLIEHPRSTQQHCAFTAHAPAATAQLYHFSRRDAKQKFPPKA